MNRIKFTAALAVLLAGASMVDAAEFTNRFAIFISSDDPPEQSIIDGSAIPAGLRLQADPIISEANLLSYDTNNNTFMVPFDTAQRIGQICLTRLQTPFVVVANGQRIYVGEFSSPLSSNSTGVPTILPSLAQTNGASPNIQFQIDRGYPPPNGSARGADRRSDPRIISAIHALFPNPKS